MIDKKYLPSKKFMMALTIAVVMVFVAIIFNYWKPNITKYKNNNLISDANATSSIINLDSDNDGLPDWKEALYGTNPQKADTDEDDTNDAEEIAETRDPLKANTASAEKEPNDKIDPAVIEKSQKAMEEYESLNATEKMSRNLMSNIFASQPINGQEIDQLTIDSIVQQSIQDIPQKEYTGITKESDLKLITVDTKTFDQNLVIYKKNYLAQTEAFRKIIGQDLNFINTYVSTGNDVSKDIAKITSQYQTIINRLITTPLPALPGSSGVIFHLTLINDLEKLIKIDNDMINSENKDMASVFSDLSVYNSTIKELLLIFQTMDIVLKIDR